MNHEAILAAARRIIEAYMFEFQDEKLKTTVHAFLTTRFFHNVSVSIESVEFIEQDGDKGIQVRIGIEQDVYCINALPHKFQQFSVAFTTTREAK